jgi:hypothetical protein
MTTVIREEEGAGAGRKVRCEPYKHVIFFFPLHFFFFFFFFFYIETSTKHHEEFPSEEVSVSESFVENSSRVKRVAAKKTYFEESTDAESASESELPFTKN